MASETTWDQLVVDNIEDLSRINTLVGQLTSRLSSLPIEEVVKKQYSLSYVALALGSDQAMVDADIDGYSDLLVDYSEKAGLRELNTGRYVVMLFHAALIGDYNTIVSILAKKQDLSYFDIFPGVLKDLVKRRILENSSVKMNNVAVTYPFTLLRVLRNQLNYKDLALLALSPDPSYNSYKQAIFERLSYIASGDYYDSLTSGRYRNLGVNPSFTSFRGLSVLVLINEMLKIDPNYPLTMEQVTDAANVLSVMIPASANLVSNLVYAVSSKERYPLQSGGTASALIIVPYADLESRVKELAPQLIVTKSETGEPVVQRFRAQLVESYTEDAWNVA